MLGRDISSSWGIRTFTSADLRPALPPSRWSEHWSRGGVRRDRRERPKQGAAGSAVVRFITVIRRLFGRRTHVQPQPHGQVAGDRPGPRRRHPDRPRQRRSRLGRRQRRARPAGAEQRHRGAGQPDRGLDHGRRLPDCVPGPEPSDRVEPELLGRSGGPEPGDRAEQRQGRLLQRIRRIAPAAATWPAQPPARLFPVHLPAAPPRNPAPRAGRRSPGARPRP